MGRARRERRQAALPLRAVRERAAGVVRHAASRARPGPRAPRARFGDQGGGGGAAQGGRGGGGRAHLARRLRESPAIEARSLPSGASQRGSEGSWLAMVAQGLAAHSAARDALVAKRLAARDEATRYSRMVHRYRKEAKKAEASRKGFDRGAPYRDQPRGLLPRCQQSRGFFLPPRGSAALLSLLLLRSTARARSLHRRAGGDAPVRGGARLRVARRRGERRDGGASHHASNWRPAVAARSTAFCC